MLVSDISDLEKFYFLQSDLDLGMPVCPWVDQVLLMFSPTPSLNCGSSQGPGLHDPLSTRQSESSICTHDACSLGAPSDSLVPSLALSRHLWAVVSLPGPTYHTCWHLSPHPSSSQAQLRGLL